MGVKWAWGKRVPQSIQPILIQLCIDGTLPVERRDTQNRGQREGKSTDAAARMRCALLCVKCVYPQWSAADIAPSSH